MKTLLMLLFLPLKLLAIQTEYLSLFHDYPEILGPIGSQGEIEVLLDEDAITATEQIAKKRLLKTGVPEETAAAWSQVGIVAEDQYLYWIRDAVRFPNGAVGTYDRIIWKSGLEKAAGVGVLPILPDGRAMVNLNYRHATRSWEIELPRGMRNKGETTDDTIVREVKEETGAELKTFYFLGEMAPDAGILNQTIPLYIAFISEIGSSHHDYSEAIASNPIFTIEELKSLFQNGTISLSVNGKMIEAHVRDAFLGYALFQADLQGYLNP